MPIVGSVFTLLVFGGLFPLMVLLLWQLFTAAASPYPMLGATVVFAIVLVIVVGTLVFRDGGGRGCWWLACWSIGGCCFLEIPSDCFTRTLLLRLRLRNLSMSTHNC